VNAKFYRIGNAPLSNGKMLDNLGMVRYLGFCEVDFTVSSKLQPTRTQSEEEMSWKREKEELF
jgi:hypothetical protein